MSEHESPHCYTAVERAAIYKVIAERRDMRHFRPDPVDEATLARVLETAYQAPSVGLMQPWRLIRITKTALRDAIHALVDSERGKTAEALDERQEEFMRLKVEGIHQCGELWVMALADGREEHVFGRRTMPEMDLASSACAIQNLWLAARAEGLGLGWVSLFEPLELAQLLNMPTDARPIAVLCIGHVDEFYPVPMLVQARWAEPRPLMEMVFSNYWGESADGLTGAVQK